MTPAASMTQAPPSERTRQGLSEAEADRRRSAGQGNVVADHGSRTIGGIVRANVLTRFNAIIASLTVVALVFGEPIDAVFGLVMVLNSAIGIVQEIRAKRSLDRVKVLLIPEIGVIRDGCTRPVPPSDLVLGDLIELRSGDQVPVDGSVLSGEGLELDESALTGESVPVPKRPGDEVLSGSFVVTGSGRIEAERVGEASWANQLTAEARTFALTQSELRVGIDRLLRTIGWLLPPMTALLLYSQLDSNASFAAGIVGAVAGVVALVPQGLVLLVSMAMAVAVVRLARQSVVVQELPAVEGLARVDVLCVDKTGTLTTGHLSVDELVPLGGGDVELLRQGLAATTAMDAVRNATADAIRTELTRLGTDDPGWEIQDSVAFSSVRKWSAAQFAGTGAWFLGAPEILLAGPGTHAEPNAEPHTGPTGRYTAKHELDRLARGARRVLLVARAEALTGDELPPDLEPVGLVALKEQVRPEAAETMRYFRQQQVDIVVISGDNPVTASAVAQEVGIPGADRYVDMRTVASVDDIADDTVVFGRVVPEQKRDLVRSLQARGHVVAMTGDGVNDIPSLKAADIGIAMDTATSATKATAQLVLLDGRFDRLPAVVAEGRRVIANMERVSALFVTKTVYAGLLAVAVAVFGVAFPFLPRHLSLIATFTIGVPAFALSFRRADAPCRPGYLRRVLRFAVPAGIFAAVTTFSAYWVVQTDEVGATLAEARTSATITLTLAGLWVLYQLVRPANRWELGLLGLMLVGLVIAVIPSPLSELYELRLPEARVTATFVGVLIATIAALEAALELLRHLRGRTRGSGPG